MAAALIEAAPGSSKARNLIHATFLRPTSTVTMKIAPLVIAHVLTAVSAAPPGSGRDLYLPGSYLRAPPREYPQSVVDIETELKRLGLEDLDLATYATNDNPDDIAYYMSKVKALSPNSFIITKARAITSLLQMSDAPSSDQVVELSKEIFAIEYPTWLTSYILPFV